MARTPGSIVPEAAKVLKKAIFVFEEVPSHGTVLEPSKGVSCGALVPTGEEVLGRVTPTHVLG